MRTLVILPTYNEALNVLYVIDSVLAQSPDVDVLVVDDNSPDGTAELVEVRSRQEPRLQLLRRERKLGLGTAYLAGFRHGLANGYAHVLTMDCDFSHDPKALPAFFARQEDADMVIGSRYTKGGGVANWPLHRRMLSGFANAYTRRLLGLPVRDCTSGYRNYSRAVLERIGIEKIRSSGYSFLEEMVWRVHRYGFRIVEIPILFEGRRAGSSKIDRVEILRAAWHVLETAVDPPRLE